MTRDPDVIVVGGGPAGASTAFQLARRGVRVRLLERARFPRAKACAECLSPQASRVLDDMGLLAPLETQGALLRGMAVRAPNGAWLHGDYDATHGYRGYRSRGLAIRRELLDVALLSRARDAGVDVREDVRVTGLLRAPGGGVCGLSLLDADGRARERRARLVVGADGLRSIVARRLGLYRRARWPERLALVAHYRGVKEVGAYGEMHVQRDGFVGIADVGDGITTVAAVFPAARASEFAAQSNLGGASAPARFLDAWLRSASHLADRFERAEHADSVRVTGPFASHARRAWHDGALLVGDAADFFDPFTGEGIYAALRGGELAAEAAVAALSSTSPSGAREALAGYESARAREFRGKWRVERLIGMGVAVPAIANRAVRAMESRKQLADLLIGVTGDFVPPEEVLRAGYLARLFLLPIPRSGSLQHGNWT